MRLGHAVGLGSGVSDACVVLYEEGLLMLKELIDILLIGEEDLVRRLGDSAEEPTQLLLLVLPPHAQLGIEHTCVTNWHVLI